MNDLCQRVDEAMAELLEGTAPEELHDHVEACDRCRDARHDAERAREIAADSGADYVPPPDMEARVERALDQAAPITERMSGPATNRMTEPSHEVVVTPAAVVPVSGQRPIVHERPAASKRVAVAQKWLRRPRNTLIAGLVGAAAVAATVALAVRPETAGEYADQESWTGKVVKVSRAAGGEGGLEVCNHEGCAAATPGSLVTAGAVLKTDDRTRVYLEMSDGSRMALDRGTELALEPEGRRGKLARGAVVAEIATQKERPVRIALPRGHIEVLGTKFALRIMGDAASVDVSRGAVLLVDEGERSVKVQAGEEGRSYPGVPPYATAAPQLGEALSWSESNEDETIAVRGLGELKAKRPGGEEKRDAVRLTSHKVKVRIVDGFARTEIDEVFTNTTNDVLEGIYRFPLPPDAQIENLSLEVEGKLESGAFVERSRAAAIWQGALVSQGARREPRQEIIWVPGPWKDPALLEWQRGGRFELRIFPIPKQGSRRVVLTYTQVVKPVAGVRRYVYPLAHDPSGALKVDRFNVDVQLRGHQKDFGVTSVGYNMTSGANGDATTLRFDSSSFVPSGDMVVEYATADRKSEVSAWAYEVPAAVAAAQESQQGRANAKTAAPAAKPQNKPGVQAESKPDPKAVAIDGAPYVAFALRPKLPRRTEETQRAYVLVLDASRSMFGERFTRASALAARVVNELDRLDQFTVLACDSTCRALPGGLRAPGPQAAADVKQFLGGITPEGASDVAASMREAAAAASRGDGRSIRVVYIGDGTPTVGPIRTADLDRAAREAVPPTRGTVTAVAIGADADLDTLGALAHGGGGTLLPYVPGQKVGEAAYAVLGASYGMGLRDARLEMPDGLVEVAPKELGTIAPGSEAMVVARMTRPRVEGTLVMRGKVGGQDFEQRYKIDVSSTTSAAHAFVPRLFAAERIHDLEREGTADARDKAVALSSAFNVASRFTSLLVLESPAMFKAFGLDNTRRTAEWTGEDALTTASGHGEIALEEGEADDDAKGDRFREGSEKKKAARRPMDTSDPFAGGGGTGAPAKEPTFSDGPATTPTAPPAPPAQQPGRFGGPAKMEKAAPSSRSVGPMGCPQSDLMCQMAGARGRGMRPMRQVFERVASIVTTQTTPASVTAEAISKAENELAQNENRREAVKALYVLLMRAGQLERAGELAERWAQKEPLDPEALTARADMAARRGHRDDAIRILGSVVDMRPGEVAAHKRLARLHRWAGREALGCRHAMAISQMRPDDAQLLAEAVFCGRKTGESRLVDEMLTRASTDARKQADDLLAKMKEQTGLNGEIRLEAKWQGGQDIDVSLIHPQGHRISWLGAPSKELISAEDVTSTSREGLALLGSAGGEYVVEIVRASGEGPIRGELILRVPGDTRTIPFVLEGERLALGTVNVRFESRLVPF